MPNLAPRMVTLGDIYDDLPGTASPLSVWLGKDISGNAVWTDLARMPHLLIAGTTGSGKSGCINTLLTSVLLRATPDDVRMILIDPKRIELNFYESIPHLLTPVVSSPKEASAVLQNVVAEMERRYERLSLIRARNLPEANRTFRARGEDPLPYLLVVIDELADLMMVSPQAVEDAIIRLAQKSRAVGIHLVLATQRPSVDVITGMIKANVPSRIAFAVSSQTDSRVILDGSGAESLLGQGDMLFKPLGTSRLQRVQGAFVTEDEIALIVEQCRAQRGQQLDETLLEAPEAAPAEDGDDDLDFDPDEDPLLDRAIEIVVQTQTASVSLLQRRLRVGYTRAGRLIDMLERRGIISGYEGSKPRRVLARGAPARVRDRVAVASHGATDLLTTRRPRSDYVRPLRLCPTSCSIPRHKAGKLSQSTIKEGKWRFVNGWSSPRSRSSRSLALTVTSIGSAKPEANDPIKVAVVTDIGGLNDKGFNALAAKGLNDAKKRFGVTGRVFISKTAADYIPNLSTAARQGYDLVVAIGFLMGDAHGGRREAVPGHEVRDHRLPVGCAQGEAEERPRPHLQGGTRPGTSPASRLRRWRRASRSASSAGRPFRPSSPSSPATRRAWRRRTPRRSSSRATRRSSSTRRSARSSR